MKRVKTTKSVEDFNGLPINIEYNVGDVKEGKSPVDGQSFSIEYQYPYGEIKLTEGEDGEPVDVYIGQDKDSDKVFVVHQLNQDGEFDEDKVFLGFSSEAEVKRAYQDHGPEWGFGSMEELTFDQFENGYLVANRDLESDIKSKPNGGKDMDVQAEAWESRLKEYVEEAEQHFGNIKQFPHRRDMVVFIANAIEEDYGVEPSLDYVEDLVFGDVKRPLRLEPVMADKKPKNQFEPWEKAILQVLKVNPASGVMKDMLRYEVNLIEPIKMNMDYIGAFDNLLETNKIYMDGNKVKRTGEDKMNNIQDVFKKLESIRQSIGLREAAIAINTAVTKLGGKNVISVDDVTKDEIKSTASVADDIIAYCDQAGMLSEAAAFFTYDWDQGSPWVIETSADGKKYLKRRSMDVTANMYTIKPKYIEGSLVVCATAIKPFDAVVRSINEDGTYKIQSKVDNHMDIVLEQDLLPKTNNIFE